MTKSKKSVWLFRDKPAVILTTDFDDACDCFRLFAKYDEANAQGCVDIQYAVQLEGFNQMQSLSLSIRPETITSINCNARVNDNELKSPSAILSLIPDSSVTSAVDLLSITLTLATPARVICPVLSFPICPQDPHHKQFVAFSRLCQATSITFYLGKNQVSPDQRSRLDRFVIDVNERNLRAPFVDLRRYRSGRGAQEACWSDIHPLTTVAPSNQAASASTRKRLRTDSPSFEGPVVKRFFPHLPSLGSPTQVNTFETRASTPSTRADQGPGAIIGIPASSGSGTKQSLPKQATPTERNDSPPPRYSESPGVRTTPSTVSLPTVTSCGKSSVANIKPTPFFQTRSELSPQTGMTREMGEMQRRMLPKITEDAFESMLGPLIDARLEDLVNRKLEALVHQRLPTLINDALEENMDKFLSNVEDNNTRAEKDFSEIVDVAQIDLCETRDGSIKEIDAFVHQRLAEFDHDIEAITTDAIGTLEDTTSELKQRLSDHVRPLRKKTTNEGLRTTTRRNSI